MTDRPRLIDTRGLMAELGVRARNQEGYIVSHVHFDTCSNFHPYECDGAAGGCVYCLRGVTGSHDPGSCAFCDPEYDLAANPHRPGAGVRTRADRAAEASRLRDQGLLLREIAERMRISRQYVSALLSDPDGVKERARRARYAGRCVRCGGPTTGSNGPARAPRMCAACWAASRPRLWTRERVVGAIQAWAAHVGRPPATVDAKGAAPSVRAQCPRRVFPDGPRLPHHRAVVREFGSWQAAIEAAGFPRPTGWYEKAASETPHRPGAGGEAVS